MRFIIVSLICISSTFLTSAHAECYGDGAHAFGCDSQSAPVRSSSGELTSFGGDQVVIIPNTNAPESVDSNGDLFSPYERRNMMRSIVLGRGQNSFSQAAMIRSMNAASRPIRAFGNRRIVTTWGR